MKRKARLEKIMEAVNAEGEVSTGKLATQFGVSAITVRRDLARLARGGGLRRTHGGAEKRGPGAVRFYMLQKENTCRPQKYAIAKAAADLIKPGMAIALDTGTTTLEVARALSGAERITVLTSSLPIAMALCTADGIETVLLGGLVRKRNPDLTGPLTEENLKRFNTHLAVLGADAITPEGAFAADVGVARIARTMMDAAAQSVLVADSGKFSRTGFSNYAALREFGYVVTDEGCPRSVRAWLERACEKVIYAALSDDERSL